MAEIVSAIVPVFNTPARYLREAIDSALAQTYRHLEVIVVDDGSSGELPDWIVGAYRADGRVTLHKKDNGGPASARNHGIRHARGDYIAFLDSDDAWEPFKTERQVEALRENPSAVLCYGCSRLMDGESRIIPTFRPPPKHAGDVYNHLFDYNFIGTMTAMVRRQAFDFVGLFHEGMELFAVEDYDMWLRIAERFEIAFVDARLARYRVSPQGISRNIMRSYTNERRVILRAIERSRVRVPIPRAAQLRRLARTHWDCASELLVQDQLAAARAECLRALALWPFSTRSWVRLAGTALGVETYRTLRSLRHAVHKRRPAVL